MKFKVGFINGFHENSIGKSGGVIFLWRDGWNVGIRSVSQGHIDSVSMMESGSQ